MPAERCPRCGTARTAGSCACDAASSVEDTAVLPHLEGPPLVRPYVAGAAVVEPGNPAVDPFATRVGPPPVQPITGPPAGVHPLAAQPAATPPAPPAPPAQPPHVPQAASPFGSPQVAPHPPQHQVPPQPPQADAAATQLLPPVPPQQHAAPQPPGAPGRFVPTPGPEQTVPFALGRVVAPPQPVSAAAVESLSQVGQPAPAEPVGAARPIVLDDGQEEWSEAPAADLGMFTFREDGSGAPLSRTGRREQRKQSADRKRLVIAGGAVGVTALGASLAMLLSSSPTPVDNALPAPTGPVVSSPVEPSPDPSNQVTDASPAPATGSASPTRTTARPSQAVTTKGAVAPSTPTAPSSPGTPSAAQSSAAPAKELKFGDTGPEVTQMQQALMAFRCNRIGPLTMDRTRTNQLGFGDWTRQVLQSVQSELRKSKLLRDYQDGVYDEATQAALRQTPTSADC
ncbi:hypothetical protein [Streptomyces sp. TLI_171]|uniref:hypothetical protein n=1 Tax=Streptomyces sp. TLI_171 TaxID=1938859 RepID=UPI000C18EECE|nr:hypothetical protein [Streptomyces sp. TLI_171]RKE18892.1 hypothetical protein BX266_2188 [Streptomyces sp. TLI_171]